MNGEPASTEWIQGTNCGYEHQYELMGAYAESIVAEGRARADVRFPALADHLKGCLACTTVLEDTLDFLNERKS